MRLAATFVVLLACSGGVMAQQASPPPSPGRDGKVEPVWARPSPGPEGSPSRTAADQAPPADPNRGSEDAGALADISLVSARAGEARVGTRSGERTLVRGTELEGWVVKSVSAAKIVFMRGPLGREETAIATFDASGRARVRIYKPAGPTPDSGKR